MLGNKSLTILQFVIFYQNACQGFETVSLNVMQYNVWGVPQTHSLYKTERMKGLAQLIKNRKLKFDILILNELWMEHDHYVIQQAAQEAGYYMTGFRELTRWYCDGRVTPSGCSGLAFLSIFPFKQSDFKDFTYKGDIFNDYEWASAKGIARVQIEPVKNLTIDVFATHIHATSKYYQQKQIKKRYLKQYGSQLLMFLY